nr:uncharacterized protein LOC115867166 isoform X1 [Globicephala melas]
MPGGASVRRRPVPRRLLSGWPPSPAAGMRPGRAGPTGFSGRGGSRAGRSRGRSSAAPVPARRAHAGVALTHRPPGPARPAAPGAPGFHAPGPGTIPAPSRQGPGAPGLTAGRWGRQPSWCPAGLNRKEWLTLQQDSFRSACRPLALVPTHAYLLEELAKGPPQIQPSSSGRMTHSRGSCCHLPPLPVSPSVNGAVETHLGCSSEPSHARSPFRAKTLPAWAPPPSRTSETPQPRPP